MKIRMCFMAPSHTNTYTVRGRPTAKKEIRRYRKELVHQLKVNGRKLIIETVKDIIFSK